MFGQRDTMIERRVYYLNRRERKKPCNPGREEKPFCGYEVLALRRMKDCVASRLQEFLIESIEGGVLKVDMPDPRLACCKSSVSMLQSR